MKISHSIHATILVILLLLVSSCSYLGLEIKPTVSPSFRETSFLTATSCAAPCWRGLEIGTSSYSQVLDTISSLKYIDQKKIRISEMLVPDINPKNWVPGKVITAFCIENGNDKPCLKLTLANDKLRDIEIILNYDLKLSNIVEQLGNPDYVGYKNANTDQVLCEVELIWVNKQLVLRSTTFSGLDAENYCYPVRDKGTPGAKLIITNVFFLPEEEIMQTIKNDQLTQYIGIDSKK